MAIQVNGTTVINNSRQLTNIASVDSTTVAALGAAGIGGSPSWNTEGTYTNNTERYGTYQTSTSTLASFPSGSIKGWGYHLKFDAKVTTNSGVSKWNIKILFSNSNSWSSNSYYDLRNWDYTGGWFPSINNYHTVNVIRLYGVSDQAYKWTDGTTSTAYGGGVAIDDGNNQPTANPVAGSANKFDFQGGAFAEDYPPNTTNSNFPGDFSSGNTIYTGYHLNHTGQYGTGYVRNFSIKLLTLR